MSDCILVLLLICNLHLATLILLKQRIEDLIKLITNLINICVFWYGKFGHNWMDRVYQWCKLLPLANRLYDFYHIPHSSSTCVWERMEWYRNQESNRLRLWIDGLAYEAIYQVNQGPIGVTQSSSINKCQRVFAFLQCVGLRNESLWNGGAVSDLELVFLHSWCDHLFPIDLL